MSMRAERARRDARRLADAGDFRRAVAQFTVAAEAFEGLGMRDESRVVAEDISFLQTNTWTAAQSKRAFSRGRSINKGRKSNYDEPGDQSDDGTV